MQKTFNQFSKDRETIGSQMTADFSQKLVFAHFQIKQKQISVCQIKVCLRLYIEKCGLSFTNLLLDAHRDEGGLAIFRKQIEEKRLNTSIF